jgi:hypothetical protein
MRRNTPAAIDALRLRATALDFLFCVIDDFYLWRNSKNFVLPVAKKPRADAPALGFYSASSPCILDLLDLALQDKNRLCPFGVFLLFAGD